MPNGNRVGGEGTGRECWLRIDCRGRCLTVTACCTQQMHLLQVQGRRLSTHPRCAQTQRSVSVSASICGPPQRAISLAAPVCVGVCMFVGVYVLVGHPGLSLPFFFIFIFCVDEFVRRSNCHQSLSAAPPTCVPFPVPVPDNHSSQLHTHTHTLTASPQFAELGLRLGSAHA